MAVLEEVILSQRVQASPQLHRIRAFFLEWRTRYSFGALEGIVLGLYIAVLAIVLPFHEPWGDEAQAWLLARDSSVWQILRYRLHYEGAPPLWHLLLHAFQLAHGSYSQFGWLSGACAAAGVAVLLRWSPFPLAWRILLPFTFFLQYQYAVVARGYALFALLLFLVCALSKDRSRPILFSVAAGLLTNLSMQGAVVASVVVLLYLIELYSNGALSIPNARRSMYVAAASYASFLAVAVYTAMPAPDVNFAVSGSVSTGFAHRALVRVLGETPPLHSTPPPFAPGLAKPYIPPEQPPAHDLSPLAARATWFIHHREKDSNGQIQPQSTVSSAMEEAISIYSETTWPISTSNTLACIFLFAVVAWLYVGRSLRSLAPWCALLAVGQIIWVTDHHTGMLFLTLLAGVWLGFGRGAKPVVQSWSNILLVAAGVLVFCLQVGWSAFCIVSDIQGSYDPGRETATYLKQNPVPRTAAFHFWSTSVQPYFDRNPFFNLSNRYWIWSFNADPDPYYPLALAEHPDRIVYSIELPSSGKMRNQWATLDAAPTPFEDKYLPWDSMVVDFQAHGYRETHRFCGTRFARLGSSFKVCDLVFEPAPSVSQRATPESTGFSLHPFGRRLSSPQGASVQSRQ